MSDIRHIVFDLGGVLLHWDPEVPFRRLIPDEAERRHFLTMVCSPAWNVEQDRGRSWREAENALIAVYPEKKALIHAYRANWREMLHSEVEGTRAILKALLARGYDVTALTNFAADTFEEARAMYPILNHFRGITVSGAIGAIKPGPEIYRHHQEVFGLDPDATLFFDDKAENVAAARAVGWKAEQFIDAGRMRADLVRYGVAID